MIENISAADIVRFWSKVDIRSDSECWIWTASAHRSGYGQFACGHDKIMAHRFAYWASSDTSPRGYNVCHSCDTKLCVNPKHLWLGTTRQNHDDCNRKGRRPGKERHWNAKLNQSDIEHIKALYRSGLTQKEIAPRFGVHQTQIGRIVRGERWQSET